MTVVAIDGPAGAGKSTLARALAARLGASHLDTGAMYRAVALAALRAGISPDDGDALAALARGATIEVGDAVVLDGADVTQAIRTPEVEAVVSAVSAHPGVRSELAARQRAWVSARGWCCVVEGRDIGTVVLPEADLKLFLVAEPQERARRRSLERGAAPSPASVAEARRAIDARDETDATRLSAPMARADDARVLDTTESALEELLAKVLAWL